MKTHSVRAEQISTAGQTDYKRLALSYLVAPIIYSMFIPALLLDIAVWLYQTICFPILKISKVKRADYIALDRHKLPYLDWIGRVNCDYCAYFNGMIAYVREVASKTELYFCPIKHSHSIKDTHERYEMFSDYGDAKSFRRKKKLRDMS